jgi:hypothetical protein
MRSIAIGEQKNEDGGYMGNIELKEIMTTDEMLSLNKTQSAQFVFFYFEGRRSFVGAVASLIRDQASKPIGKWVCIESGGLEAKWKCEWA